MRNTLNKKNQCSKKCRKKNAANENPAQLISQQPIPVSRSEFLKTMGGMFSFVVGGTLFGAFIQKANATEPAKTDKEEEYDPHKHAWVYLVDITKCIGCGMCVRADKIENNVPDNHYRTWVERYVISEGREAAIDSPDGGLNGFPIEPHGLTATRAFFVPKLCNHCSNSPCSQVCPVGASYKSIEGVQLVDKERCVGCSYCIQACPYGSRYMHPVTHTADKCTWCYHRITKGLKPACVQACPTGTRLFGDLTKPDDPVRLRIARERVQILKPDLLTKPQVKYLGLDMEVR
jgi:Fe-S-cluster-containing dehydrogenase component